MCKYVHKVDTKTHFVILMHPKEFKKTKNNTGKLTHQALPNSQIIVDEDFTNNTKVNSLISDQRNRCFTLYPDEKAISLNSNSIYEKDKNIVIFILDATWACANKMLRLSTNLQDLQSISFDHKMTSSYQIKKQPNELYLSTIESTLCVLELIEDLSQKDIKNFLNPFNEMVKYQVKRSNEEKNIRFRPKP